MHVLNILWVVFGIGLMLVLNLRFKINSMVALLLAALSVGMLAGMDLMELLHTMKSGFGSTLGELAIIVVFGAVIGKLMVDSGAAHQIAHTLLARLGLRQCGLLFGQPLLGGALAFFLLCEAGLPGAFPPGPLSAPPQPGHGGSGGHAGQTGHDDQQ